MLLHVSLGGPTRTIQVYGERYLFEMHPHCGPMPVNKDGSERLTPYPDAFWQAVSHWAQQGRRLGDDGLCVWDWPPEAITKHIGGRHYVVTGWSEPRRGE